MKTYIQDVSAVVVYYQQEKSEKSAKQMKRGDFNRFNYAYLFDILFPKTITAFSFKGDK